ncbi:MAG: VCBS repeat-containing protein [Acidobacteriaceae bacterium]|nr:VCBS repeat-containing protein [Acidobacteriaceae bacterium]
MRKSRTWMHATLLVHLIVATHSRQTRGQGKAQASLGFNEHIIASDLRGGYHVAVADLNGDGRPDIVALAAGGPDLVWYENPGWERHVLISGWRSMINCAPGDPGPDGIPDIVVAWEFANDAANSLGKVGILHHDRDPRQRWKLQHFDAIPTSHRLRWADIDGSGKKVVINAVLTGPRAVPPNYTGDHAPVVLYRSGEWKRELISDVNEGVQHGILVTRWNQNDRQDSLLTASFSGIDLYQFANSRWTRSELAKGDPSSCPKCGSSDVALGYLKKQKFLAAIEPWHGNQVVIYSPQDGVWKREVIDNSLVDGHTIVAADFDGDGRDEVVVGFRKGATSVFLYRANDKGHWTKQVVDSRGMPGSTCVAADLNADRRIDLVCIGGAKLKWYENLHRDSQGR